jgi:hypothetical protein
MNYLQYLNFNASQVCRLKLLDNEDRSTNIAFIEFAEVKSLKVHLS